MMKGFLIVLLLVVAMGLHAVDMDAQAQKKLSATLWVPEQILPQHTYHGLVVVEDETDSDLKFDIFTDNGEVINIVDDEVVVPKGKHHGIFEFTTLATGDAEIFAVYQDRLLEEAVSVVEPASKPTKLDLVIPSSVINVLATDDKITGYVFLLNEFNNPVTRNEHTTVAMTSDGEVLLSKNSVTIEPGDHYAKFVFNARAEGSITATAPALDPDKETVTISSDEEIELNIAVAPDPIPTESSGEIYFWLERDGKPYLAPHDIKITLTIDKSTNLSFDSSMKGAIVLTPDTSDRRTETADAKSIVTRTESQLAQDSKEEIILKKGSYYGRVTAYATFDSASDIKISGLAESINPGDEENIKENNIISVDTETSQTGMGTETQVFAYPDPAYDKVEIIVSSHSDQGPVLERKDESFSVFASNELSLSSPSGTILTDNNYAIVTAKVTDTGDAIVFAERNEAESDQITIETEGRYVKSSLLSITTLPVIFGVEQDLFLVTSAHDKIKTDPNSDDEAVLVSITTKPAVNFDTSLEGESIITARGTISNLSEDSAEGITVNVASNADTATNTLEIYNPERRTVISDVPSKVFPEEPFPIVNHVADLNENPISVANLKVSSGAKMSLIDGFVYMNETGSHSLIFYDANTVPVEKSLQVTGSIQRQPTSNQEEEEEEQITVIEYDIVVNGGTGSGTYQEDAEVTITAPPTKEDMFFVKKKLVGWKDLPYTEPEVTFFADENVETEPIYETDYTMTFAIVGPVAGIGALVFLKKQRDKKNPSEDEDDLLESDLEDEL